MCRSTLIKTDPSVLYEDLDYAVKCKFSVWKDLKEIKTLSKSGHAIIWSANERWCTVNGKTFNISKAVYQKRIIESDLEETFTDYTWGIDGRHVAQLNIHYADGGSDCEVLFDASIYDINTILGFLK